jgi:type II secretory pathway pseudopilin PulG
MKKFNLSNNQNGDTIVEVILALAILASVLTSAFVLTNKSVQLGNMAKERSLLVSAAQQQAELLTAHRDRNSWAAFVFTTASSEFSFNPDSLSLASGSRTLDATVSTGKVSIQRQGCDLIPTYCTYAVNYSAEAQGGGPDMTGQIILRLGNTDALRTTVVGP